MATIVLRAVKGVELDHAEVDANFTNLNNDKVETSRTITAGLGLSGGGALTGDITLSISGEVAASLDKADSAVQPARAVDTGTGLTGGGNLSLDRTIALDSASIASLNLADSAVQPAELTPYAPLASPALTGNPTAPTPAAQDDDTSIATTAFVQSTVVQSGPLAGFRNAIINGNFDIWQRGSSFTIGTGTWHYDYTVDRFFYYGERSGGSNHSVTISRQAFALGQTDVPGEPPFFARIDETSEGSGYTAKRFGQKIEGVQTFAGQQVTFSVYMKAGANLTVPEIRLQQWRNSTQVVSTSLGTNLSLTTSWQKFTFTVTAPAMSAAITYGEDSVDIEWVLPVTGTYTIDVAQVQLEPGPVATPFERRPIGVELVLCQRYFEKTHPQVVPVGLSDTVVSANYSPLSGYDGLCGYSVPVGLAKPYHIYHKFQTPKRKIPTITTYDPFTGNSNSARQYYSTSSNREADQGLDIYYYSEHGFAGGIRSAEPERSTTTYMEYHYTADAEL